MARPGEPPIRVVVTGGGTVAPIDDVRHIANASTGRFSSAISEACLRRGASVWHVHAPGAALPFLREARIDLDDDADREAARLASLRAEYRSVRDRLRLRPLPRGTVSEYAEVLRSTLAEAPMTVAFLAMAVSDYEPIARPGKLSSDRETLAMDLIRTPKVIRSVRDWSPSTYLVGFKLLSGSSPSELIAAAEASGGANRADLTVANDLAPIREGRHTIHLVRPGREAETIGPGGDLAGALVDRVFAWSRGAGP